MIDTILSATWRLLFTGEPQFVVTGGPTWFREGFERNHRELQDRVLVSWQNATQPLPDLAPYSGVVAINHSALTGARLCAGGFHYVRQFAVVPSLADVRWLIPLGSPATAAASFGLYTPYRATAKFKLFGVRAAARLCLPGWNRDRIWIAQREQPALERVVENLFPGTACRLSFQTGTPSPKRKATIAIIGPKHRPLAIAKMPYSILSRQLVQHEADALLELGRQPTLNALIPRILHSGSLEDSYVSVQTLVEGRQASRSESAAHQTFLGRLIIGSKRPVAVSGLVTEFADRCAAMEAGHPELGSALGELLHALEGTALPEAIVHGDFAPWNLRQEHQNIRAFDWEYTNLDGIPLLDEIHYRLQVGFFLEGWKSEQAFAYVKSRAVEPSFGLSTKEQLATASVYFFDMLVRHHESEAGDHRLTPVYEELFWRCLRESQKEADEPCAF